MLRATTNHPIYPVPSRLYLPSPPVSISRTLPSLSPVPSRLYLPSPPVSISHTLPSLSRLSAPSTSLFQYIPQNTEIQAIQPVTQPYLTLTTNTLCHGSSICCKSGGMREKKMRQLNLEIVSRKTLVTIDNELC